ncbi:hypothetical protein [Domibacillus mangrovi]|uniref:Uncharacterized protein n=1 Tax=Domibacillus mangrovi TaxID=1714354 RepID=A0A1Q5P7R8_9BACI|nr:hypothetical protein [Domibacillus mangrovi]OKL38228.1 hypothetical protein BLL40_02055 [Domibacillus mangrovi]
MRKKIAGTLLLFLFVYANRDHAAVIWLFTDDFTFARTASMYEEHLGTLLPSLDKETDRAIMASNVSNGLKADREGIVVRINRKDHLIVLQHKDDSETEVSGLYVHDFRLFEKVNKGEWIGEAAIESVHIIVRKNGEVISEKVMELEEID